MKHTFTSTLVILLGMAFSQPSWATKTNAVDTPDPLQRYGGLAGAAICFHLLNNDCLPMQGLKSLAVTGKQVTGEQVEMRYEADEKGRLTRYFRQMFDDDGEKTAAITLQMTYTPDSVVLSRVFERGAMPVAIGKVDLAQFKISLDSDYFPTETVSWNPAQRRLEIVSSKAQSERRFDLDIDGNVLKVIMNRGDEERPSMRKLNEYGDPSRMFSVTDDGESYIFVYDYDYNDLGHWTEQYISVKGFDLTGQLSRKINYWSHPVTSDSKIDQ